MVYDSSLSPREASLGVQRNAADPSFLPQTIGSDLMLLEVFQLHFPWEHLLRVFVHGEPNVYIQKKLSLNKRSFCPAAAENKKKSGTNDTNKIVPFQFSTGKVFLQFFFLPCFHVPMLLGQF